MKLHLYILPAAGHINPEGARRAIESFGDIPMQVTADISAFGLSLVPAHYAHWFAYIYDNEILSDSLKRALPELLKHENNNFYVMLKKTGDSKENMKVFKSPRVFRNHVQLKKGELNPVNPLVKNQYVLDGWIKCQ